MSISTFFEDNSGGFSSIRLVTILVILVVIIVWIVVSISNTELATIPESVLTLCFTLIGGKVIQRFGEKSGN